MRNRGAIASFLAFAVLASDVANAGELGKDLTPSGGEKAGNASATIPTWTGLGSTPTGWTSDKVRSAFSPYKDEKPVLTIDASNVDKYADHLSSGQVHLIKQVKDYRMDVYPSHRNCGNPEFVDANTRKNEAEAKIASDGTSLQQAVLPGVPFPQAKKGIEAIWNFLTRYQGVGVYWPRAMTYVSPVPGSGTPGIEYYGPERYFFPWGTKGSISVDKVNDIYFGFAYSYEEPAALAGQAIVQRFFFSKPSETFFYFPGQRRVRRMPTYAYDAPIIGFENQYMVDETFLFFGNPDRFDWKLLGKREMYVPYNGFAMYDHDRKIPDVMKQNFVSPDIRRYELHRVWEVEAKVKDGFRHTAPKRTFYLDEDTWLALIGDEYDANGKIWKVREGFPIPAWEIGACAMTSFIQHDLSSGRYLIDMTPLASGKPMRWVGESKESQFTLPFYSSDQLQARSER